VGQHLARRAMGMARSVKKAVLSAKQSRPDIACKPGREAGVRVAGASMPTLGRGDIDIPHDLGSQKRRWR